MSSEIYMGMTKEAFYTKYFLPIVNEWLMSKYPAFKEWTQNRNSEQSALKSDVEQTNG